MADGSGKGGRRRRTLPFILGGIAVALLLLILFWNWDWFIPLVEARASAALGRPVSITHLHVALGRRTLIRADGVVIENPSGFPASLPPLARIGQLAVTVDIMAYLRHGLLSLPAIDIAHPRIELAEANGHNNYNLALKPAAPARPGKPSAAPKLGTLTIEDGVLHAALPHLRADLTVDFSTARAEGVIAAHGQQSELTARARGTYAGQRITASLLTGALLSVENKTQPFPIDLRLANGATHVALSGTVRDPLAFAGTNLDLTLAGADMADLYPLTGIPIPKTPAYKITGKLAYDRASRRIRFDDFHGVVGNSDLEGTITEAPQGKKPDVTMDLASQRVDLADLGGFLGTNPGRATTRNATPAERARAAEGARRKTHLLPTAPFNLPKFDAANIHLRYVGHHIEGRNIPLDSLIVTMDVVNGAIDLHPLIFTIGTGRVQGDIALTPVAAAPTPPTLGPAKATEAKAVRLRADMQFDHVDLARIMAATHAFKGAGAIGGRVRIEGVGSSVATLLGHGNGGLALYLSGGDLSALLVDLSGLELGKALLSAIGLPAQTPVSCMITDFALQDGVVQSRALLLDTGEALIGGTGSANLRTEALSLELQTRSKQFSIGNLPAPIEISGTLAHPSIGVGVKQLAARGALATALGFLAAPLAVLPTVEFGVKDPHRCGELVSEIKAEVRDNKPGAPVAGAPAIAK